MCACPLTPGQSSHGDAVAVVENQPQPLIPSKGLFMGYEEAHTDLHSLCASLLQRGTLHCQILSPVIILKRGSVLNMLITRLTRDYFLPNICYALWFT